VQLDARALVEYAADQRVHVVRALGGLRQQTGQVAVGDVAGDLALVREQVGQPPGLLDRGRLGVGRDVHDAGAPAVRLGAAEAQHVDVLAGDRADHVRTGDEDPSLRAEDHHVGQRRPVRRAAGRRAEHDGDLRDLARGLRHRVEDLADRVQAEHALGQPRATGVPQADDRQLLAPRHLVRRTDDLAALVAHRAAHHGRVGAERDDRRARDRAAHGEHAGQVVGGDQLERAGVEQVRQPGDRVAGVQFAGQLRWFRGGSGHGHLRGIS
jgi:hypothetical protein